MGEEEVWFAHQGKMEASLEASISNTQFEIIPHAPGPGCTESSLEEHAASMSLQLDLQASMLCSSYPGWPCHATQHPLFTLCTQLPRALHGSSTSSWQEHARRLVTR